ncbi:hypothetical protein GCM10028791_09810 [Echinicola sediminis]
MRFTLMFLAFCIMFFQCQEKNETGEALPVIVIDHDKKKVVSLNDFVSDYNEIPLELTDKSTIKYINDIAVSGEHLYIDDVQNGVLQFNKEGEFIKVIGKKAEEGILPKVRFELSREAWDGEKEIYQLSNVLAYKQYYLVSYRYRDTTYLFIYDRSTKEGKVVQEGLIVPGLEEKHMPYLKPNGQMYLIVQYPPKPGEAEPNPSIILF